MEVANINKNFKRQAISLKANRIRLDLFSFAKNEINEHQKRDSICFSFSNKIEDKNKDLEKEIKKQDLKQIEKQIILSSQKTLNDSISDSNDSEDESSEMSCDEEENF